ncbi:MAG: hypothetical protein PGN26_15025 [Xylophilus ampelinus]
MSTGFALLLEPLRKARAGEAGGRSAAFRPRKPGRKARADFQHIADTLPALVAEIRAEVRAAAARGVRDFVVLDRPDAPCRRTGPCLRFYHSRHLAIRLLVGMLVRAGFAAVRTGPGADAEPAVYRFSQEFVDLLAA